MSATRIYVIKWSLSTGHILCCDAETEGRQGYALGKCGRYNYCYRKCEYRLSEEDARKALEEKRIKRLKSLDKQMEKVSTIQFQIEYI